MKMKKLTIFLLLFGLTSLLVSPVLSDSSKIVIKMQIGNKYAYINGKPLKMDVAPFTVPPGRTMVPIRFVAEGFGADVGWDGKTETVTIILDSITYLKNRISVLESELNSYKDTIKPVISISEPTQKETTESTIKIKGVATDNIFIKALYINDEKVPFDNNGNFEKDVQLNSGKNIFYIIAVDKAGNVDIEDVKIYCKKVSEGEWTKIKEFEGSGSKKTEPFHISSNMWKIKYTATETESNFGIFGFFVKKIGDDSFFEMVTGQFQSGKVDDETYIYEGDGDFYLDINSANCTWKIEVYEKK